MTDARDEEGLTEYERRFVEAYMGDAHCVGSHAVLIVRPNITDASARTQAYELLRRPQVQKALRARSEHDPLVMGRLERLRRLSLIARGKLEEVRYVSQRKGEDGKWETVQVMAPPTVADQMAAMEKLSKAAGEHLPGNEGDELTAKLVQLLSNMSLKDLFALRDSDKGGTTQ